MHRFPHGMAGKLAQNLLKIQLFPEVHSTASKLIFFYCSSLNKTIKQTKNVTSSIKTAISYKACSKRLWEITN